MDVLIKRIRDSRIEIRVTEQPVNCSLFFAGGSVYYDPYIWAVHPSRPTENNFWVFEYRNTGVPNNCYSLLEAHFKFLHDHSVPVEEILHEPLSGGSTPLGEEFYQMWCKDNVFALNRYNKMTEEFHNELSGKR